VNAKQRRKARRKYDRWLFGVKHHREIGLRPFEPQTITIHGTDQDGNPVSETFVIPPGGGVAEGRVIFKTVDPW